MSSKFSISISYPPLFKTNKTAFLSQNRQFQWTTTGDIIYPVIPAEAATLLSKNNYKIYWDDAIAEKLTYDQWLNRTRKRKPNLIVIETKTPVIKTHWQIISDIKRHLPKSSIVLLGDHVTALPEESLKNSLVDYILTGGDYDFMLLNLANHLTKNEKLEPGFWYKSKNKIVNSGKFAFKHHNLDDLPIIDRKLTKWQLYAFNNTNYKYKPGAYIMSGRDCWWGKCTFCSWTTLYPGTGYRSFSVKHTLAEIENLVNNFGVKEIFDDSGTLPVGPWLTELCSELINRGLNKKVVISCNMRFSALNQTQYQIMAKAGFRFILYGLESSNQKTLTKINKNLKTTDARESLKLAKKAGLQPHITVMIGYPWETLKDANNTLSNAKQLFRDGLVDSMQATIVIPYPGTPLFDYCQKNKLLFSDNWDDYDMQQPIMKSSIDSATQLRLINSLFKAAWEPRFLIRKVLSIRSFNDFTYLSNYAVKFIKKLSDFSKLKSKPSPAYDWDHLLSTYRQYIRPKFHVLEIGASTPHRTQQLASCCQKLTAVDYFKTRLSSGHQNISYQQADWQTLTDVVSKNSIDIAVSSHVLEHVQNDAAAINQLYLVLKPKGVAIINTPNRNRLTRKIIELFTGKRKFPYWEHVREYSQVDINQLIKNTSFTNYKIEPVIFGVHAGRIRFFLKNVPKPFTNLCNDWEITLKK